MRDRPGPPKPSTPETPFFAGVDLITVKRREDTIILDVGIRRHIKRRRNPEEIIETDIIGTGAQRFRVIGHLFAAQAQVPFADSCRHVALLAKHGRNG